jgi:protein disulfide-isomerase A1
LKRFVKDFTEDLLKPLYKSEDIPEKNDKPVKVVVGHNWDTIVNDKTKDVLVEFYAPWCGHCKKLTPIYNKLAETLSSNPNIVIAKIDGTLNDIEGVNV